MERTKQASRTRVSLARLFAVVFCVPVALGLPASCSTGTLSPSTGEAQRFATYPALEDVVPQWEAFAGIDSGVSYFKGKVRRPKLEFHAVRIDLQSGASKIVVAGGIDDSLSMKVSTFVRQKNLLVGINALPFENVSGREMESRINVGIVVSDYRMISPPHSGFDALVFFGDGSVAIKAQAEIVSTENIANAVGGFRRILEDGKPVAGVSHLETRHPRSAAGISPCGRFLYLLAVDGRRLASVGTTEAETAILLGKIGAAQGINFDGGGSTSLAMRFGDGKIRVVNTPVHAGIPGRERAVAGSLGVGDLRRR